MKLHPPRHVLRANQKIIAASLIWAGIHLASAANLYVSTTGTNVAPFDSWATAATGIQSAVNASQTGDMIWVESGTYVLTSQVSITGKTITIQSVNGALSTVIDGGGSTANTRCVFIQNNQSKIIGFTIRNGRPAAGSSGGGVRLDNGGWLLNCIVRENYAPAYGGGVSMAYGGTVRNTLILDNTAGQGGGGLHCDHLGYDGGNVENCTIVNNSAAEGGGLFEYQQGFYAQGWLRNLIIHSNTATTSGSNWFNLGGDPTNRYAYCCTTPLIGVGGIALDPKFENPAALNFRLKADSPAIEAGNVQPWMASASDLDGQPRIQNVKPDLGAYETGAANTIITSLHGSGMLDWQGPALGSICGVEWAPNPNGPWYSDWSTLSEVLVTGMVTRVQVPMFFRVKSVSSMTPSARISISSPTDLTSTPIASVSSHPAELDGSAVYHVSPTVALPSIAAGKITFTVNRTGVLYLAVHFVNQGNSTGGWMAERWLKTDFINNGWSFVPGFIEPIGSTTARQFEICRKFVKAGETYSIRCNKYEPPYPIEAPDGFTFY